MILKDNIIITNKTHTDFYKTYYCNNDNNSESEEIIFQDVDTLSFKIKKSIYKFLGRKSIYKFSEEKINASEIKRVLLFRYDGIGDFIATTPLIQWLNEAIPNVQIDCLASQRNISLIKNNPNINDTFTIKSGSIFNYSTLKTIYNCKKQNYDLIIALVFSRTTKSAILASAIAPKAHKITAYQENKASIYANVFDKLVSLKQGNKHSAEKFLKFVTNTINPIAEINHKINPCIYIYQKELNNIKPILEKYNLSYSLNYNKIIYPDIKNQNKIFNKGNEYIIFNISAFKKNRSLNNSLALETIKLLLEKDREINIFISGSQDDCKLIMELEKAINNPRCHGITLNLLDFIAFLAGAKYVITPDTATVHLAATTGVPVIGLYSRKYPVIVWYPYLVPYVIILNKDEGSLSNIKPTEIIKAIDELNNNLY